MYISIRLIKKNIDYFFIFIKQLQEGKIRCLLKDELLILTLADDSSQFSISYI